MIKNRKMIEINKKRKSFDQTFASEASNSLDEYLIMLIHEV